MLKIKTILCLSVIALLSLQLCGCTTTFRQSRILSQESLYQIPDLPKSELATIQIDTNWIPHKNLYGLAINKKVVLRENIRENNNEIYVVPGSHDMALLLLTERSRTKEQQSASCFSIDVKANTIYQLTAEFANDIDEALCFQLIDIETQEVVSEPITENDAAFDYKDSQNYSFQSKATWHF